MNIILGEYAVHKDPKNPNKNQAYVKPYNRPGEIPLSEAQYFSGTFKQGQRVAVANYNGEWHIINWEIF